MTTGDFVGWHDTLTPVFEGPDEVGRYRLTPELRKLAYLTARDLRAAGSARSEARWDGVRGALHLAWSPGVDEDLRVARIVVAEQVFDQQLADDPHESVKRRWTLLVATGAIEKHTVPQGVRPDLDFAEWVHTRVAAAPRDCVTFEGFYHESYTDGHSFDEPFATHVYQSPQLFAEDPVDG